MRHWLLVLMLLGVLDLPVPPVRLGDPPATSPPPAHLPVPDEDGEDPRDTPPPIYYGEEIDTETDSVIYVIDISCSMSVDGRMGRAQQELIRSVGGLAESFRFNVIAYASVSYQCFDARVPATADNKARLRAWVLNYNPHEYTATGPACAQALSDRENLSVVLLTDGIPNWGVTTGAGPNTPPAEQETLQADAHRKVIRQANTGATIDVFGIAATGNMRAFCQAVASDSGGRYTDVP